MVSCVVFASANSVVYGVVIRNGDLLFLLLLFLLCVTIFVLLSRLWFGSEGQ